MRKFLSVANLSMPEAVAPVSKQTALLVFGSQTR